MTPASVRSIAIVTLVVGAGMALPAQRAVPRATTPAPAAPLSAAAIPDERPERIDLDAIYRIKDEGFRRTAVMETAWYLTEVHGPRLTNSPGMRAAADWAIGRLSEWGLANVHKETWGPFGRGWVNDRLTINELTPSARPLLAYPRAWTPGTTGLVSAEAAIVVIEREEDFARWQGKLAGKIVLTQNPADVRPLFTPLARRYTDQDLTDLQAQPIPASPSITAPPPPPAPVPPTPPLNTRRMQFLAREGVVAVLEPGSGRSDHGALLVMGSNANRDAKEPAVPPQIVVATEQYNRLARLLLRNQRVTLELNVQNRFIDDTLDSFNIVAEIPGTDRAAEVVMLGAHFDSWHTGTGATDNAAGSAAMMEALRIIKAAGLKPRRTIRIALWGAEEGGLLGSKQYVADHLGTKDAPKPEASKLSAYFNLDNGTGKVRGVWMQSNPAVKSIFQAWSLPLEDLGVTIMAPRNVASTDHVSFDNVGIPAFQFVQERYEYNARTHHTNMDFLDRVQPDDMKQMATVAAVFAWQAANRDQMLPRK